MLLLETPSLGPTLDLSLDEALLDLCESGALGATLRLWTPREPFVVLGYSNDPSLEADLDECRRENLPVLRRLSGGGAVLQGPGCLNFSLVHPSEGDFAGIASANRFVLERHRAALTPLLGQDVRALGTSDLALGERKFSGNSQRRLRHSVLFHGTFLLGMDLARMGCVLRHPSKEPSYRLGRGHGDFVVNLGLDETMVREALRKAWEAKTMPEGTAREILSAGRQAEQRLLAEGRKIL